MIVASRANGTNDTLTRARNFRERSSYLLLVSYSQPEGISFSNATYEEAQEV